MDEKRELNSPPSLERSSEPSFETQIKKLKELVNKLKIEIPANFKENKHFWFLLLAAKEEISKITDDVLQELNPILETLELEQSITQTNAINNLIAKIGIQLAIREVATSKIDKLTKAWKRDSLNSRINFFQTLLTKEKYSEYTVGLYFFDIDHFKEFNDKHGHQTGDIVLQELVAAVLAETRPEDSIFRYGGEEFCVLQFLTPDPDKKQEELIRIRAKDFHQRVIAGVNNRIAEFHPDLKLPEITFSMGAVIIKPSKDPAKIIEEADAYMYVAKNTGRNKVAFPGDTVPELKKHTEIKLEMYKMWRGKNKKN